MTINQRLKEYSRSRNISNIKLSEIAGCSQQVVGTWFTHNARIKGDYILKIIEEFKEINARWLITGEGEMLECDPIQTPTEIELTEFGSILMERLLEEKEKVGALTNEIQHLQKQIADLKGELGCGINQNTSKTG